MEVVFIDPEPPDAAGGGIRTYIRLALRTCREAGHPARVYTHNPSAYPDETASPIGRRPWLRRPFRGLAYRLAYAENVLWEHAHWLDAELSAGDVPGRVYEFCDFQGYGFFTLRNRAMRERCLVRIHTPHFLVAPVPSAFWARLAWRLGAWREKDSLRRALRLIVPSAEFAQEKLPWLRGWTHVPNPLPPDMDPIADLFQATIASPIPNLHPQVTETRALPEGGGSGWSPAEEDPKARAERNAPRPTRIQPHRLLYLGRVEERKGVIILVRAFIRLAAERPYATLTLVGSAGSGPYAAAVRYLIESLPPPLRARVAWEKPCSADERPGLFRRFTALAAPSLWENSPYVYFEGMAAGLPCLGSATGEMKAVAAITGALSARPGDEDDWLRILRAHCDGEDRAVPAAQRAYLREQRARIPELLLASWLRASEGA